MAETYRWTLDAEFDWGGRTNSTIGLTRGLPRILKAFREAKIKALFFISTETLESVPNLVQEILEEGHEIGSHGHFHTMYREDFRKQRDMDLSTKLLAAYQSIPEKDVRYRAPKFNYEVSGELYSCRKAHVSLLKHMWLKEEIKEETIIYLHPFDIVETNEKAPNLFCKLWYSKPKKAYENFLNLVKLYPGSNRLV